VKNTATKIDRATLLKNGGTAAVATLLMGALEGRADACCSPIDLMYTDDPPQMAATSTTRKKSASTPVRGLWLWSDGATPAPDSTWTLIYSIPSAHVNGHDENGAPHGQNGKARPLGYTISVYVKS
jgi:hypothetical protein